MHDDAAISVYYSLHPTEFYWLDVLEIRQVGTLVSCEIVVKIELLAKNKMNNRRLVLSFEGVREWNFIPSEFSVVTFSFIEIIPIRERKLEGLNYRVFETEQDTTLSFLCRDFSSDLRLEPG